MLLQKEIVEEGKNFLNKMEIVSQIQTHLYNIYEHKLELKEMEVDGFKVRIYEPLVRIHLPNIFKEGEIREATFYALSAQSQVDEIVKYLCSHILSFHSFTFKQVCEFLSFTIDTPGLNKLKALVGKEIESRLENIDLFTLAESVKVCFEKGYNNLCKWLLFHVALKKPTGKQLDEINFSRPIERLALTVNEDKHLTEIFYEVISKVTFAESKFFLSN